MREIRWVLGIAELRKRPEEELYETIKLVPSTNRSQSNKRHYLIHFVSLICSDQRGYNNTADNIFMKTFPIILSAVLILCQE